MAPVEPERRELDPARFRRHGMIAGLLGAAALAAWFLLVDALHGHPLATPTFLGEMLLSGGASDTSLAAVEPSLGFTLMFTAVHALAFVAIGVTVAEFLRRFDLVHSKALRLVLLLGALLTSFALFAVIFAAVGPDALSLRDAVIGNVLAAFAMAGYLGEALGEKDQVDARAARRSNHAGAT
jgi:hypothetical protein